MKKKKLLRKIIELQELNDCLFSTITALRIQLWGKCTPEQAKGTILERTKEPESKEQNDKRREIYEAQKPIDFPKVKTEGPESESELKENTISLEVGKKYEAENGYKLICKGFDETSIPSQRYQLTFEDGCGQMHYSKEGKVCVRSISKWDIVSEVKE